ncbi:unnamed protein product, partial [Brenthis ino]
MATLPGCDSATLEPTARALRTPSPLLLLTSCATLARLPPPTFTPRPSAPTTHGPPPRAKFNIPSSITS